MICLICSVNNHNVTCYHYTMPPMHRLKILLLTYINSYYLKKHLTSTLGTLINTYQEARCKCNRVYHVRPFLAVMMSFVHYLTHLIICTLHLASKCSDYTSYARGVFCIIPSQLLHPSFQLSARQADYPTLPLTLPQYRVKSLS